jgi:hypothetical protein
VNKFPDEVSIGDKYGPAMELTEQPDADAYFEKCIEHTMRFDKNTRERAESIERANLGYYAGYYSNETRARVERLFHCAHPIFGEIAVKGPPTPEEALAKGIEMGRAAANGTPVNSGE